MTDMVMSQSIGKIAPALLKAQSGMSNASKDAKNPFFKSKYADLNSVREASHPLLNANGITVLQPTLEKNGKNYVRTLLLHESGEYIGSDTEIIAAKANDPQAHGSGISYARRYGLQSLISLGASDDDAEASMGRGLKPGTKESTKATVLAQNEAAVVTNVPATESSVGSGIASGLALEKKGSSFRPPKKVEPTPGTTSETEGWQ